MFCAAAEHKREKFAMSSSRVRLKVSHRPPQFIIILSKYGTQTLYKSFHKMIDSNKHIDKTFFATQKKTNRICHIRRWREGRNRRNFQHFIWDIATLPVCMMSVCGWWDVKILANISNNCCWTLKSTKKKVPTAKRQRVKIVFAVSPSPRRYKSNK